MINVYTTELGRIGRVYAIEQYGHHVYATAEV